MRYLLLAAAAALLLPCVACHVHVDRTAPIATRYAPPASPAHRPLSEVAVIYLDQWGISEPDYLFLRDDLHLSDDDIGVVLFLSARSSWNWRRIAYQRRAGHGWQAITRMVGLTPLVYFVDIPRGAHLRPPYQGLYEQYWRHRNQPQRIHLGYPDYVAMARLHLVHDRYGYDPIAYMTPGPRTRHDAFLQELEQRRRTGKLHAAPPSRPLAHEINPDNARRRRATVHDGHDARAEHRVRSQTERNMGRGSVARGAVPAPVARDTLGHAASRPAGPPSGHGARAGRAKANPPAVAGFDDHRERRPGSDTGTIRAVSHRTPATKGVTRTRLVNTGRTRGRLAASGSTAPADDASPPVTERGLREERARETAAAHAKGRPDGRRSTQPVARTTADAEQDGATTHPPRNGKDDKSLLRPTDDQARGRHGVPQSTGEETHPGVAGSRGDNRTHRINAGGARAPESTRESTSAATPPHHDPGTPVVTERRNANGPAATAHPVKSTPRQMETAGATRPGKGKGQTTRETDGAEVPGSSAAAAAGAGSPANRLTATPTTARGHQRRSDQAVSGPGKGGTPRFADMDADEPEAASPDNAPPRGKP